MQYIDLKSGNNEFKINEGIYKITSNNPSPWNLSFLEGIGTVGLGYNSVGAGISNGDNRTYILNAGSNATMSLLSNEEATITVEEIKKSTWLETQNNYVNLAAGEYKLNVRGIQTIDPSDYWKLDLLSGSAIITDSNKNTYDLSQAAYSSYLDGEQTLTLTATEAIQFNVRTEEGWDYPNDDNPTNPVAQLIIDDVLEDNQWANNEEDAADNGSPAFMNPVNLATLKIRGFGANSEVEYSVNTGGGDRAASSLGRWIMGDSSILKQYGTEGSALHVEGLTPGSYELDWSMLSGDKYNNPDKLYGWNGREIIDIAGRGGETQISKARWTNQGEAEFDVPYGELYLFAMDLNDKRGTTEFVVNQLSLTHQLDLIPEMLDITGGQAFGHYRNKTDYVEIGSSSRDRAVSSCARELGANLDELTGMGITEGSLLTYSVPEGGRTVELIWQYRSRDNAPLNDKVLVFDESGSIVKDIDLSGFQNIGTGRTFTSDRQTLSLSLNSDTFTIGVFDVGDKRGSSYARVTNLEVIG